MIEHDVLRRFIFTELGVRGEWVKLTTSWQTAKQNQQAPEAAIALLGEAYASVALLSAMIKFTGSMILQLHGDGEISTLVTQATHEKKIRGCVRCVEDASGATFSQLIGNGQLVLTVDTSKGDPYQGIVSLEGESLAQIVENYFSQSEQLKTRLWLFANDTTAVGLLLQEIPTAKPEQDDWERLSLLADTLSTHELLTLDCSTLLHRLYHEDDVRLFDAEPITFECSCSRSRIEKTLLAIGRSELEAILSARSNVEVVCEFCGAKHLFDLIDIEALLKQNGASLDSATRH